MLGAESRNSNILRIGKIKRIERVVYVQWQRNGYG